MSKLFFILGSLSGFISVALGAFGAHGLKTKLTPEMLKVFETGVRYEMYHALALIAAAWACTQFHAATAQAAGWLFVIGTVIFSGSLYLLVLSGVRTWGAVTPVGGLFLLAGWMALLLSALRV